MEEEYGPYHKRKSCMQFVKWVDLAGGRVRGSRPKGEEEEEQQQVCVWM
jgi:hypothetical protein